MVLFEAFTLSWLKAAPISQVSKRLGIRWDEAWGMMDRAVRRGIARRTEQPIKELGIDETSFQKRHEYVTVIVDRSTGTVVEVLDDRKKGTLKKMVAGQQKTTLGSPNRHHGHVGRLYHSRARRA